MFTAKNNSQLLNTAQGLISLLEGKSNILHNKNYNTVYVLCVPPDSDGRGGQLQSIKNPQDGNYIFGKEFEGVTNIPFL